MAKRKTAKAKDLRPEAITPKQLERLQKSVSSLNTLQAQVGSLEAQKHEMLHMILQMRDVVSHLQQEFKKEYGTDNVEIDTGKIKYNESTELETNP